MTDYLLYNFVVKQCRQIWQLSFVTVSSKIGLGWQLITHIYSAVAFRIRRLFLGVLSTSSKSSLLGWLPLWMPIA